MVEEVRICGRYYFTTIEENLGMWPFSAKFIPLIITTEHGLNQTSSSNTRKHASGTKILFFQIYEVLKKITTLLVSLEGRWVII
jgi:hypothetical protein